MTAGAAFSRTVAGRPVTHSVGPKTHTFSVSRDDGPGHEVVYRFPRSVPLTLADVPEQHDLAALHVWMLRRRASVEVPAQRSRPALPAVVPFSDDRGEWLRHATAAVERALRSLVDDFRSAPHLHRVEHSLHAELFSLLRRERELAGVHPLLDGGRTQLVHKEWPETYVRHSAGKDSRGLFDLVVLDPEQLARASAAQFLDGRIEPPIAIEVGLDYGQQHLEQDVSKMQNSYVRSPYLLHLSRRPVRQPQVLEGFLDELGRPFRTAYAQVTTAGGFRWRYPGDSTTAS